MQEQEMIAQLLQQDERGMEALLLHYGPLMRYIIAPILPDPQDRGTIHTSLGRRLRDRGLATNQTQPDLILRRRR